MKRIIILLFVMFASVAAAQNCGTGGVAMPVTPNLHLCLPPQHYPDWHIPTNINWNRVDQLSLTWPKLNVSNTFTQPQFMPGLTLTGPMIGTSGSFSISITAPVLTLTGPNCVPGSYAKGDGSGCGSATTNLTSPGPIGGTTPSTGNFTNVTASSLSNGNCVQAGAGGLLTTIAGPCSTLNLASPGPIGANTPSTGNFTNVTASGNVSATSAVSAIAPVNVMHRNYGAKGDGVTNDTAAFLAASVAAAGSTIKVPPGTYIINNLALTVDTNLVLDDGAVLKNSANGGGLIGFSGNNLSITGGTLDGNQANQSITWPHLIVFSNGPASGQSIKIHNVKITNTAQSLLYTTNFGGLIEIEDCTFTGQAENNGAGNISAVAFVESGQSGAKGLFRFNHNILRAQKVPPTVDGGSPGGVFFDSGITPGSSNLGPGNFSTLEAIGNHFWGYGQIVGTTDISPLHFYPQSGGARLIGNYFEACGFSCVSAKSVNDFVFTSNVILNGQNNTVAQIFTEGAVGYEPGYNALSLSNPRAVFANNICDTPGSDLTGKKQSCFSLHGTATSHATDVIVSNNIISGAGKGVYIDYLDNAQITGNSIRGATGGTAGSESAIEFHHTYGDVIISNNQIWSPNGYGLVASGSGTDLNTTANFFVSGNTFQHSSSTAIAATLRGVNLAKFSGNTFNATAGSAVSITQDGAGNPVNQLAWDTTNTVLAGTVTFDWLHIGRNVTGPLTQVSEWKRYSVLFIANSVNGCVSALGCIQVTAPDSSTTVVAATATATQVVQINPSAAYLYLMAAQIKSTTACTGATGLTFHDLSDATSTVFYAANVNYDLMAAVSNTNVKQVAITGLGAGTVGANYVGARLNVSSGFINATAAGCAFDVSLLTSSTR